jgi:hypothetical protein
MHRTDFISSSATLADNPSVGSPPTASGTAAGTTLSRILQGEIKMEPMWITTLMNALIVFLTLAIPVVLIALGVSLGLRSARGKSTGAGTADQKSQRNLYLLLAVFLITVLLFLFFNIAIPPGQAPLPFLLPILLILLAQFVFWVPIIAGAVWLVLWLARRMGVVGPKREKPLDILKARYARGEISAEQFEEMKCRLGGS